MLNCGDGAQMPTADDHLMGDRNYENRKGRKQKRVNIGDAVKRHEVGESRHFLPERGPGRRPGMLGPGQVDALPSTVEWDNMCGMRDEL